MTIVILLVFVALLWAAVLAPSVWRRFSERSTVDSIDHFHHQLHLLEHAGPKTVPPAYRLHTAFPGEGVAPAEAPVDLSRPKLVLLRPTGDATAADVDDAEGCHYERVGVLDRPEPACLPDGGAELSALRRERARRRCTTLLWCLGAAAISTGLIGMMPGLHVAWVFTGLTGLAALGLVGLMAYAKELEAERARRRVRGDAAPGPEGGAGPRDRTPAGYPGAWDDEFEVPRAVAH